MSSVAAILPLAYRIEDAGPAVGAARTRIFEAVRNGEMTARKAGRATIIETSELKRWLASLPIRKIEDQSSQTAHK